MALAPAPPHCWPELEFRDRFGADGVQLFWYAFKTKWQSNRTAHPKSVRHRAGLRRGRDAGTVYFERAFAKEKRPAIYMLDARNGWAVCPMFAFRRDYRAERARSRAAGAYAFSLADVRCRSHIMWRGGGASKRSRFMILFLATLF